MPGVDSLPGGSAINTAPEISVDPAAQGERALISGLFQFYIYDFAEMYGGGFDDVGDDGRYPAYSYLDSYWTDADRMPFVVRSDGRTAGFVLVNTVSHRSAPIDHAVAEFFILRQFRRGGTGRAAAQAVFQRYPGKWELAIAHANTIARAFWPKVVSETPGVTGLETFELTGPDRPRQILAFEVAPPV